MQPVHALVGSATDLVASLRPTNEASTLGYVLAVTFAVVIVVAVVGWWIWGRRDHGRR